MAAFPLMEAVTEFHRTFGHPVRYGRAQGEAISEAELDLAVELIREEFDELVAATGTYLDNFPIERPPLDYIGTADALGDIAVTVFGLAIRLGIDMDAVLRAIHTSNMSKLGEDGKPIYRADGKILKGKNYQPPKIAEALGLA